MLAFDYRLLSLFWTIAIFFIWVAWFIAAVCALLDNFNNRQRPGWAKALWALIIIVLPLVGVFAYLASRASRGTEL